MKIRYIIPFLVLILILGLIGCGNPYKSNEAVEYLEEFEDIKEEFMDKYNLAGTTARIALTPIILEMQNSKRDLSKLTPPEECEEFFDVQELCLIGMDKVIEGFQEFQMDNEFQSFLLLQEADEIFVSVDDKIDEIKNE